MPVGSAHCRLTLLCAALAAWTAAPRARAQAEVADLREDVRGLNQRVGDLTLRVEQLEHENAELKGRVASLGAGRGAVTPEQLNTAVADMNASIKAAVDASRGEILQRVAGQMENMARQTNAALDALAKAAPAAVPPRAPAAMEAPRSAPADAAARQGVSYTVQKGDSLGLIAKKTGAKAQDIIEANRLADPSRIQAGQVLFIPGGK